MSVLPINRIAWMVDVDVLGSGSPAPHKADTSIPRTLKSDKTKWPSLCTLFRQFPNEEGYREHGPIMTLRYEIMLRQMRFGIKRIFASFGSGLITGASDDDPSGIATYSQAGAQFGYGMLWTMLFSYPLMTAIQEISAHIGRVTGHGIAGNIRRHYSSWLLYFMVFLLFSANTINLGVDLAAMAAAVHSGDWRTRRFLWCGTGSVFFVPGDFYSVSSVRFLFEMAYAGALRLCRHGLCRSYPVGPSPESDDVADLVMLRCSKTMTALIALFRKRPLARVSFFWQASEEAEEVQDRPTEHALKKPSARSRRATAPHSPGYLSRNGFFEYRRVFHYFDHRCYSARSWRPGH